MPDNFLIKLRRKDQQSWKKAYQELWSIALKSAQSFSLGLNRNDVEDVAADVLRIINKKTTLVDSYNSLKSLTSVIAKRRAVSKKRMLNAARRSESVTASLNIKNEHGTELIDLIPSSDESPLSELQETEVNIFVKDFISTIKDEKVRNVISSIYVKGLSNIETAKKLNIPSNSVGVYKRRGIIKLIEASRKNKRIMKYIKELLRY